MARRRCQLFDAAEHALGAPATVRFADPDMRRREERSAARPHRTSAPDPLPDQLGATQPSLPVAPRDVTDNAAARTRVRPAGTSVYRTREWPVAHA